MKSAMIAVAWTGLVVLAVMGVSGAIQGPQWEIVADNEDATTGSSAVVPDRETPQTPNVTTREPTWHDREPVTGDKHITATTPVPSNCTLHREQGTFGGSQETQQCY
jgi:hypothetical protein